MKTTEAKTSQVSLGNTVINLHTTPEKSQKIQNAVNHCSQVLTQLTPWELKMVCSVISKYNLSRD
jgi:hypothetical protein